MPKPRCRSASGWQTGAAAVGMLSLNDRICKSVDLLVANGLLAWSGKENEVGGGEIEVWTGKENEAGGGEIEVWTT